MSYKDNQLHLWRNETRFRYGSRSGQRAHADFWCVHCHGFVSADTRLSGVQNRNHCPYCLWSRHVDLNIAGDRLSACKSPMRPIGLTIKTIQKKYGISQGELLLIHLCEGCNNLSLNRIAADDDPANIFAIFEESFRLESRILALLDAERIVTLTMDEHEGVFAQLFGHRSGVLEIFSLPV